jgi:hypothetical protein
MDTIWRNTAKKVRTCEKQAASRTIAPSTPAAANPPTTAPTTVPPPTFFDPETRTLEELEQTSHRLQRDWPKEDGIPFPAEILETLKALKVAVITQDAERSTAITPVQTVQIMSPELTQPAAKTSSKKAEKKCCLREKRALAKIPTSVGINAPVPVTAQSRAKSIAITSTVYKLDTATPAPALTDFWRKVARKATKMGYHQENYGTTLRTRALTVTATTPAIFHSATPVATPVLIPVPIPITTTAPTLVPTPTPAPASPTTTDMNSTTATGLVAVVTPTTVEQHDTKPPDDKEIQGNTEGREDERQQTREENNRSTGREETGDDEGIGQKRRDERAPAPVRTVEGSACELKQFD